MPRRRELSIMLLAAATGAIVIALPQVCAAQEAGSVDLTQIEPRLDVRRPPARPGEPVQRRGILQHSDHCDGRKDLPALQTTLVGLDRREYETGDEPRFEVRITNVGLSPLKIPFSPDLADLQPQDAGERFAFSRLNIQLWIVAGKAWSANTGGGITLYGSETHPGTMLTLKPGEWAEVTGTGEISFPDAISKLARARNPVTGMNAGIEIAEEEMLATPTASAGLSERVCMDYKRGPDFAVKVIEAAGN